MDRISWLGFFRIFKFSKNFWRYDLDVLAKKFRKSQLNSYRRQIVKSCLAKPRPCTFRGEKCCKIFNFKNSPTPSSLKKYKLFQALASSCENWCKQTADLPICTQKILAVLLHFDEISTRFLHYLELFSIRCIFQNYGPTMILLYVQGVHFVNHWTRTAKLRNWQHGTPKLS